MKGKHLRQEEMGTVGAYYSGPSEGQDRAPQAQNIEHHIRKIRNCPLRQGAFLVYLKNPDIGVYSTVSASSHESYCAWINLALPVLVLRDCSCRLQSAFRKTKGT